MVPYNKQTQSSGVATFEFEPERTGTSIIAFQLDLDGIQYDNVTVEIAVESAGEASAIPRGLLNDRPNQTAHAEVMGLRQLDLIFYFKPAQNGRYYAVEAVPISNRMEQAFEGSGISYLREDGSPREFETSLLIRESLQIGTSQFASLRALFAQSGSPLLEGLSNGGLNVFGASGGETKPKLNRIESRAALELLYDVGRDLSFRIFDVNSHDGIAGIWELLERYNGNNHKPLRIKIMAHDLQLPWQLLTFGKRRDRVSANDFWGMRFLLNIIPDVGNSKYYTQGTTPRAKSFLLSRRKTVFAIYGEKEREGTEDNILRRLGELQADWFRKRISAEKNRFNEGSIDTSVTIVSSNTDLLNELAAKSNELTLFVAFTHGSSGAIEYKVGDEIIRASTLSGNRLLFGTNNEITPDRLLQVRSLAGHSVGGGFLFDKRPIVFLNGCETGTSGYFPGRETFPRAFLKLGARGVISTEAPVPQWFGYHFGREVMQGMLDGDELAAVLFEKRRQWYELAQNPLGLLYSYHGPVEVRMLNNVSM